ncbi:MAG: universal stress protein [Actinobacteria bacterium]|nr:MAG: universal stress protein [Actinomycetota bacterium]
MATTQTETAPEPTSTFGELHFHRLLVAVDGSQTADLALSAAVTAARRDHAAITLLAVVPDILLESRRWIPGGPGAPDPRALQEEADAEAQRLLRQTVERIPGDIPVTTVIRHGKPGPEIVAQARERDYDGILLGARGVGRVGALVGSVSGYVLRHAGTSVFVAHAPASAAARVAPAGTV